MSRCLAVSASGSCRVYRRPAWATSTALSQTMFLVKRFTSCGRALAGDVAAAYAFPRSATLALRNDSGRDPASFGSTSESGERGIPSSPTEVFSSKRPATFSSESRLVAKTVPVTWDRRRKLTTVESPGGMVSTSCVSSPSSDAPLMFLA